MGMRAGRISAEQSAVPGAGLSSPTGTVCASFSVFRYFMLIEAELFSANIFKPTWWMLSK